MTNGEHIFQIVMEKFGISRSDSLDMHQSVYSSLTQSGQDTSGNVPDDLEAVGDDLKQTMGRQLLRNHGKLLAEGIFGVLIVMALPEELLVLAGCALVFLVLKSLQGNIEDYRGWVDRTMDRITSNFGSVTSN